MSLLKELSFLNEGAVKRQLQNRIDAAIKSANLSGLTYAQAVDAIVKEIEKRDDNIGNMGSTELKVAVRDYTSKEDLQDLLEDRAGYSPWEILNAIAEKDHGEFGFATLPEDEAALIIKVSAANKLANDCHGEDFFSCNEKEMKKIVNANPDLLKGKAASQFKKQLKEDSEQQPDANAPEADDREPEQRLIKTAGGYNLVATSDAEQIMLYDSAGKLIVQMPSVIWKQLTGAV